MTSDLVFSVIIPTYNRPERLTNCLSAIADMDYESDRFEVVVVDDGSKISLNNVVSPFSDKLQIQLLRQENAGPAAARNKGASIARGEFLAFTDDDCCPCYDWLKILAQKIVDRPNYLVGGYTVNALKNNLYASASQAIIDYVYSQYNKNSEQATFFTSSNLALSKIFFHKVGGFDSAFAIASEDRDFCARWLASDYKMIYVPSAKVYHHHNLTLQGFWRQHFNYGRGAFYFHRRHKQPSLKETNKQPLSFYFNLLVYPFSQTSPPKAFLLTTLFILSQIATTLGIVQEWSHS